MHLLPYTHVLLLFNCCTLLLPHMLYLATMSLSCVSLVLSRQVVTCGSPITCSLFSASIDSGAYLMMGCCHEPPEVLCHNEVTHLQRSSDPCRRHSLKSKAFVAVEGLVEVKVEGILRSRRHLLKSKAFIEDTLFVLRTYRRRRPSSIKGGLQEVLFPQIWIMQSHCCHPCHSFQ